MVSQAPFSFRISSQVNTPDNNSNVRPIKAVVVGLTTADFPKIISGIPAHKTNRTAKITSMIFSCAVIGPCSFKRSLAKATAFGVCLISGGYSQYMINGMIAMATKPGNNMANAQVPQEI